MGYWRSSGLLRAWQQSFQAEAVAREGELFRGIPRERRGRDDEPKAEDTSTEESAGILDDNEIDAWIDWQADVVAAPA